jgi:hypothetical protein
MKFLTVLFLLFLAGSGCQKEPAGPINSGPDAPSQSREARIVELRQKLLTVTTADGISKSEADLIAQCYFLENVGCGAFTGIQDGKDFWIVDAKSGLAGTPVNGFHIDKRTGKITSPIGPSYAIPSEIFR